MTFDIDGINVHKDNSRATKWIFFMTFDIDGINIYRDNSRATKWIFL